MICRIIPATIIATITIILFSTCDEKSTGSQSPVLTVSPLSVDFGMDQVGLRFYINNSGGSTLEWSVEDPAEAWYEYSPGTGSILDETDTVEVAVDRTGLTGEFADTIAISSNGGSARVEILMQVPTSPTLSVYPLSLDFGTNENMAFVQIINTGPGHLEWSIDENLDWLTVDPDSGSTGAEPETVAVSIHRPNLSNDPLNGELMLSSNGGSLIMPVTARDTVNQGGGIYAFLTLERRIMRHHMGYMHDDMITARFDGDNSPCEPSIHLAPDSVYCNEYTLLWNAEGENFEYYQTMPRTFLTLGETYFFNITGGSSAPSLTDSVTFPLDVPFLSSPLDSVTVSRSSDLSVEWTGAGENQVTVSLILSSDSTCAIPYDMTGLYGISVVTDNDGQFVFLSSQLAGLVPGEYRLILNNYTAHPIIAAGYAQGSFIMAKSTSYVTIYLQ